MYAAGQDLVADQGVVVKTDVFDEWYVGSGGIIVTPRCDIAQNKAEFLLLCAVLPVSEVVRVLRQGTDGRGKLGQIMGVGEPLPRWHWLEPIPGHFDDGAAVDFQAARALRPENVTGELLCCLEGPYREQLAQRYAAYMGRIGVDAIAAKTVLIARRNVLWARYEAR